MAEEQSNVSPIRKGGRALETLNDWLACAGPKGGIKHWKDGRSAKESARAWLGAAPGLVPDIAEVIDSCPDIGPLRSWHAEPEKEVDFDDYDGPANIDLLIVGEDDSGPIVVAIEAKVDEPFSDTIAVTLREARRRLSKKPRSKGVARLQGLASRFGIDLDRQEVLDLRYQLLTCTAAAITKAQAQSARRALFIVHEFVTPSADMRARQRNSRDLDHYLHTLFHCHETLLPGNTVGAFSLPGCERFHVGKAQTHLS